MSIIASEITILVGSLARDPDMRYMPDGLPMCRFSIAVNRGKDNPVATWYNVISFRETAERCHEYLKKGSTVQVEGIIGVDKNTGAPRIYEKDGVARTSLELIAHNVKFLGDFGKKEEAKPEAEQDELPF